MPLESAPSLAAFIRHTLSPLHCEEQEQAAVCRLFQKKHYARKTFLLQAGSPWQEIFFLQQGLIRLYYIDRKGREHNKAFYHEGQCIWPPTPMDRTRSCQFSIDTLEEVTLMTCPFATFHAWMRHRQLWERFALPWLEQLLRHKFTREHDFLLLSAQARYERFCAEHPTLVDRLPDYHLASYLGMTNVSLSRIKKHCRLT